MTFAASEAEEVLFSAPLSPLPADFVKVIRWISAGEAEEWEHSPFVLPSGRRLRGAGECLPVAEPGTKKPAGTGSLRLEFFVSRSLLVPRVEPGWFLLKTSLSSPLSVLNMRIIGPRSFLQP